MQQPNIGDFILVRAGNGADLCYRVLKDLGKELLCEYKTKREEGTLIRRARVKVADVLGIIPRPATN